MSWPHDPSQPCFTHRGERYESTDEAADILGIRAAGIRNAIYEGSRYAGRFWARVKFIEQGRYEGEDEPHQPYIPVYSSDGRRWINASYVARRLNLNHNQLLKRVGTTEEIGGLRWSRRPFEKVLVAS